MSAPRPTGPRLELRLRKKILLALIINVGILSAVEATVRAACFVSTRNTYYLTYGMYDRRWGPKYRDYLQPYRGYFKFRPNKVYQLDLPDPTPTRINNHGFRGDDFDATKPAGTFRLITLGESSTFGFHSRDPYTYPKLLRDQLNRGACAGRIQVLNAGMPWVTSAQILAMTKAEILKYQPDLITLYAGHNDAVALQPEIARARLGWNPSKWWSRRTLIARELTYAPRNVLLSAELSAEFLKRAVHYRMDPERARQVNNDIQFIDRQAIEAELETLAQQYRTHLEDLIKVTQAAHVPLVLITQAMTLRYTYPAMVPYLGPEAVREEDLRIRSFRESCEWLRAKLERTQRLYDFEVGLLKHERIMDVLKDLSREYAIPVIDFIPTVDREPDLLVSFVHLSEEGNARLASVLLKSLRDLGLLPCTPG